jgi:MSHA biogenesis protein MshI
VSIHGSMEYLKDKLHLSQFFSDTPRAARPGLCCIGITPHGFTIALVQRNLGKIELNLCESVACDKESFPTMLAEIVAQYSLEDFFCSWMLQQEDYQVLTIEELPVTAEEMQNAIRWKIKKLLSFPIEDALIDSFIIPAPLVTDGKKSMSAVVAKISYISPIVDQLRMAGLNLTLIDIPELGLRNISALYEDDEHSTALVSLREKNSNLLITRQKEFYLSRRIDWNLQFLVETDEKTTDDSLDRLALELQRSFDYYQTQWRCPPPGRVLLGSAKVLTTQTAEYLSQRLTVPIQLLNLNNTLRCKNELSMEHQSRCLSIIGGALRDEIP